MNKTRLVRFINKYYLSGTVNSVVLNSDLKFDVDYKEDLVKLNNFVLKHKINFKTLPENIVKCYE